MQGIYLSFVTSHNYPRIRGSFVKGLFSSPYILSNLFHSKLLNYVGVNRCATLFMLKFLLELLLWKQLDGHGLLDLLETV